MNKKEFLENLNYLLSDLAAGEREEALLYYEDYFADAGEENEAEVIASLGSPEQVAKQIKEGLAKTGEGLFTENGYREKTESDNPPDIYEKVSGQDSHQNHGYGRGNDSWNSNGQRNYKENNDTQGGRTLHAGRKKKSSLSGGMIALLVILCILASPMLIALGGALIGIAVGLLGAIFGITIAVLVVVICFLVVGVSLFAAGICTVIVKPFTGMVLLGVGCLMIAAFLLSLALLVVIFGKFFPWLIKEVESFGNYLKRKWNTRKKGGEIA